MSAAPAPALPDATPPGLDALAEDASGLGYAIVDISGFLEEVERAAKCQITRLGQVEQAADALTVSNREVREAVEAVDRTAGEALRDIQASLTRIRETSENTTQVASWVRQLSDRVGEVEETLKSIQASTVEISSIALQVNILAINAKIEAARAGEAGRGFSVVADAVNELSRKTGKASEGIEESIQRLADWARSMTRETTGVRDDADRVIRGASETDAALNRIAEGMRAAQEGTAMIASAANGADAAVQSFRPSFQDLARMSSDTAAAVAEAHQRAETLIDRSERIVQGTVALGGVSADAAFIERVQADAGRIARIFEEALEAGRISENDLFSARYQPIPGSNPEQVMAPFTQLTDAVLPEIQEAALRFDRRVIFCAAVDRNGYLPTHNRKFSQPQGQDPVWNAANCRNRRIFADRVGLKAGRNTAPFLLQVYRRDMGGGEFRMMKDLSAPIHVRGRHWGGLRLAYTF